MVSITQQKLFKTLKKPSDRKGHHALSNEVGSSIILQRVVWCYVVITPKLYTFFGHNSYTTRNMF